MGLSPRMRWSTTSRILRLGLLLRPGPPDYWRADRAKEQECLPREQSAAEFLFAGRRSVAEFQQLLHAKQHRRSSGMGPRFPGRRFSAQPRESVVFNQIRSPAKEDPSILDSRQYVLPSKPKSRRVSKNRRRSSRNRRRKSRRVSKNRRRSKSRQPKS